MDDEDSVFDSGITYKNDTQKFITKPISIPKIPKIVYDFDYKGRQIKNIKFYAKTINDKTGYIFEMPFSVLKHNIERHNTGYQIKHDPRIGFFSDEKFFNKIFEINKDNFRGSIYEIHTANRNRTLVKIDNIEDVFEHKSTNNASIGLDGGKRIRPTKKRPTKRRPKKRRSTKRRRHTKRRRTGKSSRAR